MSDIKDLSKQIKDFCEERNWKQFHNLKDLSISLVLEANEVMEHFQWKNEKEIQEYITTNKQEIGEELADVFYWILLISNYLDIDLVKEFKNKMTKNEKKYPVEKSKDKHTKYNKL